MPQGMRLLSFPHQPPTANRQPLLYYNFLSQHSGTGAKMNNGARLLLIGTLAGCAGVALAQQQDFSKVEIKVSKVAGNVYMLQGAGGNIGASVGEDGIAIVDDQFAPLADKIRAALKGITDKPLRFIINTHYHFDHTGGNLPLHDATIIAHDNVRKRLSQASVVGNGGSLKMDQAASPKEALPVITFQHDVKVHMNGEEIRALHVPNGHTDGDSIVFFPKSNVVHMGDDFVTYGFPFIDINGGGSTKGLIAALESAMGQLPADVKVIPGHGPVSTLTDVRSFVTMVKETRAAVEKAIKAGKTLEQLKQEKVLEPWQKHSGPFVSTDLFIETLYNELTGKKMAAAVKHN
jgi:cyclase